MTDFFDFLETPLDIDLDVNGIPDLHETQFVSSYDAQLPDAINSAVDVDGDGIPDQHDGHIDVDGSGLDYRTYVDSGSDGMNDWLDPYSPTPGTGLSAELTHYEAIKHINPYFPNK